MSSKPLIFRQATDSERKSKAADLRTKTVSSATHWVQLNVVIKASANVHIHTQEISVINAYQATRFQLRLVSLYCFNDLLDDGSHKCIKSTQKCSPDYCNFKGSCEITTIKGKEVPTCKCKDLYSGNTCNKCKDPKRQFPGCHTIKTSELEVESMFTNAVKYEAARKDRLMQKCVNAIPPNFDTFEDLKYNGEARLSGVYSLSDINNVIALNRVSKTNSAYNNCLFGKSGFSLRVYVEFLEESYVNRKLPIVVTKTSGDKTVKLGQSKTVMAPGLDQDNQMIRGEYLELDLNNDYSENGTTFRQINFDVDEILNNEVNVLNNG